MYVCITYLCIYVLCIYICMYVLCIYVYMYVLCIYICIYVCMYYVFMYVLCIYVLTVIARFQALIAQTAAEETPCNHRKHKIQQSDKVEKWCILLHFATSTYHGAQPSEPHTEHNPRPSQLHCSSHSVFVISYSWDMFRQQLSVIFRQTASYHTGCT